MRTIPDPKAVIPENYKGETLKQLAARLGVVFKCDSSIGVFTIAAHGKHPTEMFRGTPSSPAVALQKVASWADIGHRSGHLSRGCMIIGEIVGWDSVKFARLLAVLAATDMDTTERLRDAMQYTTGFQWDGE